MDTWRINVRTHEFKKEPVPQSWQRLGGRGFLARILPEWMTKEMLPPHNTVFDVPEDVIDTIFDGIE